MSSFTPSRVFLVLLALGAIVTPGCKGRGSFCVPQPTTCPPVEDDAGCTGRRFVAIVNAAGPCPTDPLPSPLWTGKRLFKGAPGGPPAALARYCVYEWTGGTTGKSVCKTYGKSGPGEAEINHLKTVVLAPGTEIGEDCIDTGPLQSAPFETQADTWARRELFLRAGGVDPLPTTPAAPTPARLVAIDTSPTAGNGIDLGQSRHGDTIAHLARDLACPNGEGPGAACAAHVRTTLGLPRADLANPLTTNLVSGGFFGTEGDLAQAIEGAVSTWHNDIIDGKAEPRLVVNLSVGWEDDPERSNCAPPNLRQNPDLLSPPARAVADALRYANCHGALVLAAAGNDTGGPNPPSGMVCPARWEELDAPSDKSCAEFVGADFLAVWSERFTRFPLRHTPGVLPAYERLAYAVGGVDYADQPLLPLRRGARPRLSGLGFLGAAWDTSTGAVLTPNANGVSPTPPPFVTGTSVATAVASAVAAAAWSYNPTRTASTILGDLYASGVALQRSGVNIPADSGACVGAGACDVHRVSLCRAIGAPCNDAAPAGTRQNPEMSATLTAALAATYSGVTATQIPFAGGSPIPHTLWPTVAASPWTFPQPSWPACPACVASLPNPNEVELYARTTMPMTGLTVIVVYTNGDVAASRAVPSVAAGAPIRVRMTGMDRGAKRAAWISGQTTTAAGGTVSVSEQVVLSGP